jgi:hypothetical protein
MSPSTSSAGDIDIVQHVSPTKNCSERVLSATSSIFVKKSEHNNQMNDAAAIKRRPTFSRHCGRCAPIAFGMRDGGGGEYR